MQPRFVVSAVSDGERLAMYSKPAVVRIVDGAAGQIRFEPPGYQPQTYNVSSIALGSGFFISSNGYIATNAHVVSTTRDGEEKAKQAFFYQMLRQIAQQLGRELNPGKHPFYRPAQQLREFSEISPRDHS